MAHPHITLRSRTPKRAFAWEYLSHDHPEHRFRCAGSVREAPSYSRGATPHLDATKALHHALPRPDGVYTLQVGGLCLVVDPSKKGEPGDIVVVWPRKKGPMVARRLARCAPYSAFHFRELDTGDVFDCGAIKYPPSMRWPPTLAACPEGYHHETHRTAPIPPGP